MKLLFALFLLAIAAEGAVLDKGDFCEEGGRAGTCVPLSQCDAAVEDIRRGKKPKNCGFQESEPIVCCLPPSNHVLTTTSRAKRSATTEYIPTMATYVDVVPKRPDGCPPIPPVLTSKKTGQRAWDKCLDYQEQLVFPCAKSNALGGGLSRTNRCHHNADELIVGGDNAAKYEFPHMALLRYGDDRKSIDNFCGGALISENFVLTAGHCIANSQNISVSYAVLGELKRTDNPSEGRRYKVKNIIKHPNYKPPEKYNDIALLELETPVTLDEFTVPACLHTGNVVDDSKASATGWGRTLYRGTTSDLLQKVILTKFESVECTYKYGVNHNLPIGFDPTSQMCFGDRRGVKDTCEGDSGGPLHVKSKDIACMYIIIGVTSTGIKCGLQSEPGLYTKVDNYIGWIEDTVWPF